MPRTKPRTTQKPAPVLSQPGILSIGQKVVTTKVVRSDKKRSLPVGTAATVMGISNGTYKILARSEYAWAAMDDLKVAYQPGGQ